MPVSHHARPPTAHSLDILLAGVPAVRRPVGVEERRSVMGVTQQDIADALKVSLITVHRALNDSGYVSRLLKERILAYARDVHYVPHKASQILLRNKVRKIAIFSSALPHYFWNDIRTGITIGAEQIQAFNYQVNYRTIPERNSRLYMKRLKEEIADGVEAVAIVNQWIFDMKSIIATIERKGIPYVTLNVDAPDSNRLCYIGPDYRAGGRLAAEYIGKILTFKKNPHVLVITTAGEIPEDSSTPDLNKLRYEGFLQGIQRHFGRIAHEVGYLTTDIRSKEVGSQIEDLLRSRRAKVDAIYLIPAYNTQFIQALEKTGHENTVIVLHDLDSSANHYLEKNLQSTVIYQNPILQGYYAVKILENVLESGHPPDLRQITIEHSLLLNENKNLYKNHYLFARMID
jgi:LacI family transcriptional regulator